jgi:ABC-2 type transport system ATP-binding protein
MSSNLAIHCRGLSRTFRTGLRLRRSEVLRGVNLDVPRGTVLGLMGPNGSGKSTLLRILAGVDLGARGDCEVLGARPDSGAALRNTGYLPEESPFPPDLSGVEALELLGALQGTPTRGIRELALHWLERVGLADASKKPLGKYSRGMLRRFGLAQAWFHQPDLILFDEPTAGLDAEGFEVLDGLLAEARSKETTIVFTSHLLSDLVEYCTDLAVLLQGVIAARGTPGELLREKDRVTLQVEGLSEVGVRELNGWLEAQGARVVSQGEGVRSLLEVYRALGGARPG